MGRGTAVGTHEKHGVLRDDAQRLAERRETQRSDVHAVNEDTSALQRARTEQGTQYRALAGACTAISRRTVK